MRGVVVARVDRQAVSGLGHGLEGCSGAVGVAICGFTAQVFADQDEGERQAIDSTDQILSAVGVEGDGPGGNPGEQGKAGGGVEFGHQFGVAEQGGGALGEGLGEVGLRLVECLGQAVAGLFVLMLLIRKL